MKNEATVQADVRLMASRLGWGLWRNNVGVLLDSRGVPVRYGLANDSKGVNANIKSGDLIGIRTRIITPEMIGSVIGQFVSRECKREGWKFNPNDPNDRAQQRWIDIINSFGGDAAFTTGEL
jgi:hypothetical protein